MFVVIAGPFQLATQGGGVEGGGGIVRGQLESRSMVLKAEDNPSCPGRSYAEMFIAL